MQVQGLRLHQSGAESPGPLQCSAFDRGCASGRGKGEQRLTVRMWCCSSSSRALRARTRVRFRAQVQASMTLTATRPETSSRVQALLPPGTLPSTNCSRPWMRALSLGGIAAPARLAYTCQGRAHPVSDALAAALRLWSRPG